MHINACKKGTIKKILKKLDWHGALIMLDKVAENPLWRFSLSIYNDTDIKQACHVFQDIDSANINLILFSYWLGYAVKDITHTQFTQICQSVLEWNKEVTTNMRKIRTYLKIINESEWITNYYKQVLTDEIASEFYQQELLYNQTKHLLKEKMAQNNSMSYQYLVWLFNDMGQKIHKPLKIKIEHFIQMISNKLESNHS